MSDKQTEKNKIGKGKPGPGRKKGIPNVVTRDLREMILGALSDAGGRQYLLSCAQDPKLAPAFLSLVGKVLPTTLETGNVAIVIERSFGKREE